MVPTSLNRLITYNLHLQFARLVQVVDHSTTSFPEGLRSPRVGDCYHTSELYLPFDNMVSTLYVVLSVLSLLCHIVLADVDGAIYRLQNSLPGKIQTRGIPPPYNPRFNAANGYSPAAMVYVSSAEDIIAALEICHDEDAPVALRSDSGHSFIGQSTVDGGIVINFMKLRDWQITMEGDRYIAKLGSGLNLLEIYSRLARHDPPLGIAGGVCPSVGIAGVASGGGYGTSSAKYGATTDRVVAAEVVVYNREEGQFELVTATGYNEHSDLLFAVRGGMGGNYGALVSISYDAFPVTNVVSMVAFKPLVDLSIQAQSIKAFQEFMHSDAAGPQIYSTLRILGSGSAEYNVQCICDADCMTCHAKLDTMQAAVGIIDPLRIEQDFGKSMWFWAGCTSDSVSDIYPSDGIGSFSEEELQEAMTSCLIAHAAIFSIPYKPKCMFFPRTMSIGLLESVVEALAQPPCDSPTDCVVLIHFQGQALSEEPKNCDLSHGKCTAYDHRSPGWLFEIVTSWGRDETAPSAKLEWMQNLYDAVFPASLGTSYQNCVDLDLAEGRKWIDQFFPNADTYRRLQQVKCRYNAVDMFNFPAIDLMTIDIDGSICEAGITTTSTTTNAYSTATRTTTPGSISTSTSTTSEKSRDCREADRKCSEGYPGSFCMTYKLPNICRGSNVPCSCTPGHIPSSTTTRSVDEHDCSEEDLRCATLKQGSYCMYWKKPSRCKGTSESCDC